MILLWLILSQQIKQILLSTLSIINYLPSPEDKNKAIGYSEENQNVKIELNINDTEVFSGLVFKIITDQFVGKLTFVRIYTGTLKVGSHVYNSSSKKKERISKILRMFANRREEIDEAFTGDIIAVPGFKHKISYCFHTRIGHIFKESTAEDA